MRILNSVLLVITTMLLLSSCSKYNEGPAISLRSAEKRLIGLWEFSSIKMDGVEYITYYFNDSTNLKISISGSRDELFAILVEDNRSSAQLSTSLLELNESNTEFTLSLPASPLYIDITENFYALIPVLAEENVYSIERLSVNELWISTTWNNQLWDLQLSKLDQYLFNP